MIALRPLWLTKQNKRSKIPLRLSLRTRRRSVRSPLEGLTLAAEPSAFVGLTALLCCLKAKKNQRLFLWRVCWVFLACLLRRSQCSSSPFLLLRPCSCPGKNLLSLQRCFLPFWTVSQCNPCPSVINKTCEQSLLCTLGFNRRYYQLWSSALSVLLFEGGVSNTYFWPMICRSKFAATIFALVQWILSNGIFRNEEWLFP